MAHARLSITYSRFQWHPVTKKENSYFDRYRCDSGIMLPDEMVLIHESLCRELDHLLLDVLNDVEKYTQLKVELEKTMNAGFVNIAKTRYINGRSSVTTLQLPTENSNPIEPQAVVHRVMREEGRTEKVEIINKLTPASHGSLTRYRGTKPTEEKPPEKKTADPIRMFGVLVPQALRDGQKSFISAVQELETIAQVDSDLDSKLKRYFKLLSIKEQLISEE